MNLLTSIEPLSFEFVRNLLNNNPVKQRLPFKRSPQAGEIYVFKNPGNHDFLRDGYIWLNQSSFTKLGIKKTYYKISDPKNNKWRKRRKGIKEFQRHTYVTRELVLVHYLGDHTIKAAKPRPHGNSTHLLRPFMSRTSGVFENIKNHLQLDLFHKKNQRELYSYLSGGLKRRDRENLDLDLPTGAKQLYNVNYNLKKAYNILPDEILSAFEYARFSPDYVWHFQIYPSLLIVLGDQELVEMAKICIAEKGCQISYDTTFDLIKSSKKIYVSPLIVKNVFLENTNSRKQKKPFFPIAFLIHDNKSVNAHDTFFKIISQKLDIPNSVPIVTDREASIRKAIKQNFPNSNPVYCFNHIRKDVAHWIKYKSKGSETFQKDIQLLMCCKRLEDFVMIYNEKKKYWTKQFRDYANNFLYQDMQRASRFYCQQFPAFRNKCSTNNASEGFNQFL